MKDTLTARQSTQIVALLENQITDLKSQLEKAETRETARITEKSKRLDLTDRLQKQNETLMLPPAARFFSQHFAAFRSISHRLKVEGYRFLLRLMVF